MANPKQKLRDETGPDSAGQSGDLQQIPDSALADSESVEELIEEGNAYEAGILSGVENAPDPDVAEVRTREASPINWAATQNNLGNALLAQGQRSSDADGVRLAGEAVAAYRAALEVRTRKAYPINWAGIQHGWA